MENLNQAIRKEIANEVWRVFALHSDNICLSYDGDGITIRVPFIAPMNLGGPEFVAGQISDLNQYTEIPVGHRKP